MWRTHRIGQGWGAGGGAGRGLGSDLRVKMLKPPLVVLLTALIRREILPDICIVSVKGSFSYAPSLNAAPHLWQR